MPSCLISLIHQLGLYSVDDGKSGGDEGLAWGRPVFEKLWREQSRNNYLSRHACAFVSSVVDKTLDNACWPLQAAFREKAMECHPDQNQENKESAEAKFKEVLNSYEAIKSERGN
ncbi:hypothetical protein KSP39_PZI000316 [Platanthera zijinensis]|uniref:J domain-containing protein n=1 Tax=Platanthera zijinensis TaxID=2320716 RepID=A0AAP0GFW1_9ASPA